MSKCCPDLVDETAYKWVGCLYMYNVQLSSHWVGTQCFEYIIHIRLFSLPTCLHFFFYLIKILLCRRYVVDQECRVTQSQIQFLTKSIPLFHVKTKSSGFRDENCQSIKPFSPPKFPCHVIDNRFRPSNPFRINPATKWF